MRECVHAWAWARATCVSLVGVRSGGGGVASPRDPLNPPGKGGGGKSVLGQHPRAAGYQGDTLTVQGTHPPHPPQVVLAPPS